MKFFFMLTCSILLIGCGPKRAVERSESPIKNMTTEEFEQAVEAALIPKGEFTADELISLFDKNALRAERDMRSLLYWINMTVHKTGVDRDGKLWISYTDEKYRSVIVKFGPKWVDLVSSVNTVSYTHLTLPTILLV